MPKPKPKTTTNTTSNNNNNGNSDNNSDSYDNEDYVEVNGRTIRKSIRLEIISTALYERFFRSSFVHIYIYEFIVGMGTLRYFMCDGAPIVLDHK